MKLFRVITLLSCSVIFIVTRADAQSDIKRDIFDNCSTALDTVKTLSVEQRQEIVVYLERVITLPWDYSSELPQNMVINPGSTPIVDHSEIWRTQSPERNIRAKQCSVELASLLAPESKILILPIVELLDDWSLSDELREEIYNKLSALIVDLSYYPNIDLAEDFFDKLLNLRVRNKSFYIDLILSQFAPQSILSLVEIANTSGSKKKERVIKTLNRVDYLDESSQPAIITLYRIADQLSRLDGAQLFCTYPDYDLPEPVECLEIEGVNSKFDSRSRRWIRKELLSKFAEDSIAK